MTVDRTLPASTRVTRGGETLTARMWAALEDAYIAAGMDPGTYLVVTHGSWDHYSGSGSTHDGGGAADLRTWNLPSSVRADLCRVLVVELRKRCGLAVWYRDATHGGMDPHIHVIMRDEPGLASGAVQQVRDADAGRNGLSSGGPDYHPRPDWTPYVYGVPTAPTDRREPMFGVAYGSSAYRLITPAAVIGISRAAYDALGKVGLTVPGFPAADVDKIAAVLGYDE